MAANKVDGTYHIATSPAGLTRQMAQMAQNGAYNSTNKQALNFFQDGLMHETENLSAGSDIANGYLLREGSIGVYPNFPYDFANRTQFAGKSWSISDAAIPNIGMRCNIYVNNEATNAESLFAGSDAKMTHFQETAIWSRFYVITRPCDNLATKVTDIVKIKLLNS
jgi:hypothetical protein